MSIIEDCPPEIDMCESCRKNCTEQERAACEMRKRQEELLRKQIPARPAGRIKASLSNDTLEEIVAFVGQIDRHAADRRRAIAAALNRKYARVYYRSRSQAMRTTGGCP